MTWTWSPSFSKLALGLRDSWPHWVCWFCISTSRLLAFIVTAACTWSALRFVGRSMLTRTSVYECRVKSTLVVLYLSPISLKFERVKQTSSGVGFCIVFCACRNPRLTYTWIVARCEFPCWDHITCCAASSPRELSNFIGPLTKWACRGDRLSGVTSLLNEWAKESWRSIPKMVTLSRLSWAIQARRRFKTIMASRDLGDRMKREVLFWMMF